MKGRIKALVICLFISVILTSGIGVSFAQTELNTNDVGRLKTLFDSIKKQYLMSHTNPLEDAGAFISYANFLCSGDAILIWDDVFDNDGNMGNSFSKHRMLVDGSYILFQTESDANSKNDTLILININEFAVNKITDRSEVFNILDQMDKNKNDGKLQDSFNKSISKEDYLNNSNIRISLSDDKFQIMGIVDSGENKIEEEVSYSDTDLDSNGLITLIKSIKYQYTLSHDKPLQDGDSFITYANYLCSRDATLIWDDVLDHDGIMGNTVNKNHYYAVDRYILFQTKADIVGKNDTLIIIDISEPSVNKITDRSDVFNILTYVDKGNESDVIMDSFGQTVSKSKFMKNTGIKILLRNDKFQITGGRDENGPKIKVSKVITDVESLSLKQGEKYQLAEIVMPYDAYVQEVKWSSDNSAIATVDNNGNVRAKKVGTTYIKVTTVEGNKSFKCKVDVKKNPYYYYVGQTGSLYCAGSFEKLTWSSSNTDVVDIIDEYGQTCTIECLKEGTATVTVYGDSYEYFYDSLYKIVERKLVRQEYAHYEITVEKKD